MIPDEVRYFNLFPETGHVSFTCVLPCVVSGDGPEILLTTDSRMPSLVYLCSVLVHSLCSPYRQPIHGHLVCEFRRCKFYIGRQRLKERKKERKEDNTRFQYASCLFITVYFINLFSIIEIFNIIIMLQLFYKYLFPLNLQVYVFFFGWV